MRFDVRLRRLGLLVGVVFLVLHGCADKDTTVYEPDTTPPFVLTASESDGRISWTTNEECMCVLLYGTRSGVYDHYGYHVSDGGITHHVDLIDVAPATYYMRIIATDHAGNTWTGDEIIFEVAAVPETENLVYTMVDVGWGDCHFLEFPGGTNVMIDAGYGDLGDFPHSNDVFAFLEDRGIPRPAGIDYMIATHNHGDHYGGFINLLGYFTNTTFLAPRLASSSVWENDRIAVKLADSGVPRDSLSEGQTNQNTDFLKWDEEHDIAVRVLSAGAGRFFVPDQEGDSINCDSAVFMVTYGKVDILLMADAEQFVEQRMVKTYGSDLDCEILKVGHHGSNDASSEEFIEVVSPRVGLIPNSLEENDGVFAQPVINRLLEYHVDYYVSDRAYRNAGRQDEPQHGHVTVTTDGETFSVWTWD